MKRMNGYIIILLIFFNVGYCIVPENLESINIQSLNGIWKFKLFAHKDSIDSGYQNVDFDDRYWDDIAVPGNWDVQGFEEPQYGTPEVNANGVYRKFFHLPQAWAEKHIILYTEAVSFGYELWINGHRVGSFISSFQRAEFDLTEHIRFESENCIVIRVYRDHYQMRFDTTDDWAFNGIFRHVYLYAAPYAHIEDLTIKTEIVKDYSSAKILGQVDVNHFGYDSINVKDLNIELILSKENSVIFKELLPVNWVNAKYLPSSLYFSIPVESPALWTAETPNLYDLEIILKNISSQLQTLKHKVGIREISIDGCVFKINDEPVKLRGVCWLEGHPLTGRAMTKELWLQDLQLMKNANINAIRMTHWPPPPELLDFCDQMGFYVLDEVPFDFGDEKLNDPHCLGALLERAQRTIDRDKNHPSIIIWCVGNEHPSTRYTTKVSQFVKMLDDTRPILFPHNNWTDDPMISGIPDFIDFYAPHYKDPDVMMGYINEQSLQKPVLFTEYNHSLDVSFGGLAEKWELMEKYEKFAGGMIWVWADQGIYRKVNGRNVIDSYKDVNTMAFHSNDISGDIWIDDNTLLDSHGQYGTDGIVYADRKLQTDYWQTRKVYSPVKILESEKIIENGIQNISLTCINRYDFINLKEISFDWKLLINNKVKSSGSALMNIAPHDTGIVNIPLLFESIDNNDEMLLECTVTDYNDRQIYEHSVRLLPEPINPNYIQRLNIAKQIQQSNDITKQIEFPEKININDHFFVSFKEDLLILKKDDEIIFSGPFLRVGRNITLAERRKFENTLWEPEILEKSRLINKKCLYDNDIYKLYLNYEFTRPNTNEKLNLELLVNVLPEGLIRFNYSITPHQCTGFALELGLALQIPTKYSNVSWLGDGPYPSYPEKSELSERGFFTKTPKSLYFNGNHMNVDLTLFHDSKDVGFAMFFNQANARWDLKDYLYFTHNLLVAGYGTKFYKSKVTIDMSKLSAASGDFLLSVFDKDNYPQILQKYFSDTEF